MCARTALREVGRITSEVAARDAGGSDFKPLRKSAGLSQARLGDILGYRQEQVCWMERGHMDVPIEVAERWRTVCRGILDAPSPRDDVRGRVPGSSVIAPLSEGTRAER